MVLEENKDGDLFLLLDQKDIVKAIWKYYNLPAGTKLNIIISPDKASHLSAAAKIP